MLIEFVFQIIVCDPVFAALKQTVKKYLFIHIRPVISVAPFYDIIGAVIIFAAL